MKLSDRYSPKDFESRLYEKSLKEGRFKAEDVSTQPPYAVILPPPNITGQLHLGHALNHTIQDVLVRWKRQSGFNTLWMPGSDHAGIATQSVVEKDLKKKNVKRKDLGREKFVEKVWEWKETYGGRIKEQMQKLGDSCDWDRETFTLDDGVSRSVRKVFVNLYEKGSIYRGQKLINWSPALESAISDLEVEFQEIKGQLWHIRYALEDGSQEIIVATTRPETMLGDTAVAVHPTDERYKKLIGKKIKLPLTDRLIPIIGDEYVEKDFGSGAVKITPAHDFNDYEMGERHGLEKINLLEKDGRMNENAGSFSGLKVQEARKQVIAALENQGFLEKVEPHTHQIGHCSRSGCVVEPYLSEQWFMKMTDLAGPARHVVENGTIQFEPAQWTKTYLHWMSIIQDWCISRQLWWGHRIPAWKCESCGEYTVAEKDPSACVKCGSSSLQQDEDVLDTWFSSALWPFSTLGWPSENEAIKTFYPTQTLVTGHDIIFFWVARMILMGLEFTKDVPFRKVYIHGLVRDSQGRKMSKSLGNSEDPVKLIEEYGADSLRFTLMASVQSGRDLKFSQQRLEGYRNFMNKIWNATRFSISVLSDISPDELLKKPGKSDLDGPDHWILYRLAETERSVDENLESLHFSEAALALYSFIWNDFCDWYLELIKPRVYGEDVSARLTGQRVLVQVLDRVLRLLYPFCPFISEELYSQVPGLGKSIHDAPYPHSKNGDDLFVLCQTELSQDFELVKEVISALRNIRGENRIGHGEKIMAKLSPKDDRAQKILGENKSHIMSLAKLSFCEIIDEPKLSKCAFAPVISHGAEVGVIVPLEGLVDFDEEVKRLQKAIEKSEKEAASLNQRLGNTNFVKNAPAEVVEQGRRQLVELSGQIAGMKNSLEHLK